MARKVVRFTPDQMGYKDRGIMKWQGLILSDHTDALKKIIVDKEPLKPKEVMSEVEISSVLQLAYLNKVPVNIQRNILVDGNFTDDVTGIVKGYAGDRIILKLKDDSLRSCYIEDVRNIEYGNIEEWYDK